MNTHSWEVWSAIALAICLMQASPGPAILTLVAYTIEHGRDSVVSLTLAYVMGQLICAMMTVAGVALLLTNVPNAVYFIRFITGCLLISIGLKGLLQKTSCHQKSSVRPTRLSKAKKKWSATTNTWLIAACSPIALIFYLSLLPEILGSDTQQLRFAGILLTVVAFTALLVSLPYVISCCVLRKVALSGWLGKRLGQLSSGMLLFTGIWALSVTLK